MKYFETTANIWTFQQQCYVVIPTNGFVKNNGDLVMGAGLARQANDMFQIANELGQAVKAKGNHVQVNPDKKLISFPTKHHWTEDADIALVEVSMKELVEVATILHFGYKEVVLPRVGCGNGKLDWSNVKLLFDQYLDERFMLVNPKPKWKGTPGANTGAFSISGKAIPF